MREKSGKNEDLIEGLWIFQPKTTIFRPATCNLSPVVVAPSL
jgi:hypothetical protein